jgi:hypothetical protein
MNPTTNITKPDASAQLPPELLPILSRLGPGLVLVHFCGLTERHPIFNRGGNVAGGISRELVREQAGQHVETAHFESHRTYFFSALDTEKAARLLLAGAERLGLQKYAQIFTVANEGLVTIRWPLPSSNQAPAKIISHGTNSGCGPLGNAAGPDTISALSRAVVQRIKTGFDCLLRARATNSHGARSLMPDTPHIVADLSQNQPAGQSQKPNFQNEIQNKISVPVLHTGVASVGVHRF